MSGESGMRQQSCIFLFSLRPLVRVAVGNATSAQPAFLSMILMCVLVFVTLRVFPD